jgi:hypothetical protein
MFVKIPLKFIKKFKFGVNIIANRLNIGIFNMSKYVDIIVDIIISKDNFV